MTADEWEAVFHGIELPETAEIATGVKITNVQGFLEKSLTVLRSGQNKRVTDPIEWRLEKLLTIINKENEA